jgi:KDO2-lipid IV(A) lauroyltransferase
MFTYYLWSLLLQALSRLPASALFLLGSAAGFILNKVVRYRKKTVLLNIRKAFPQYTESQVKETANQFYGILGERIAESIKAISISKEEILQRCAIKDLQVLKKWSSEGKSIVALLGHCGSWEWAGLAASIATDYPQVLALYNPPNDRYWAKWIKHTRERWGMRLVSMRGKEFIGYYKQPQRVKTIHLYVADQSPRGLQGAVWCSFLNSRLPFFSGAARYAVTHRCAVLFVKIVRIKKGYHQIEIVPMFSGDEPVTAEKIIETYAVLLEKQIYENPADWLWSHKRWKHQEREVTSHCRT